MCSEAPWRAADEFFVLAHREDGKIRIPERLLVLGVGASLLGEVVLEDKARVVSGRVQVVDRDPPVDALAHQVLAVVLSRDAPGRVRDLIGPLGMALLGGVRSRLVQDGRWVCSRRRGFLARGAFVQGPVDANEVFWRGERLAHAVGGRLDSVGVQDALVAGLVGACGLGQKISLDLGEGLGRRARHALTARHDGGHAGDVLALLDVFFTIVGDSVLSPR
jgi:hypothetical protein